MDTYRLVEQHGESALPGKRYDVVTNDGARVACILQPGIAGNERYGLYLPAIDEHGAACFRIHGAYPGIWYATKEEALGALMALGDSRSRER